MFKEFKEFAMKGNLIDIAVGLVMATAFGLIVTTFIDGVFMPIVGKIFQLGDFAQAKLVLAEAIMDNGKVVTPESAIHYGKFISAIINFLIIAFVMFQLVRAMNSMKKAEEAAPAPTPVNEVLLAEIRDLLKR